MYMVSQIVNKKKPRRYSIPCYYQISGTAVSLFRVDALPQEEKKLERDWALFLPQMSIYLLYHNNVQTLMTVMSND